MTKKKKQNTFTFPMYQWGTNEYGFPVNTTHNWKSTSSISKKTSKNKSRKTVYKSISGNIYTTEKEAVNDNEQYLSDPLYRFNYKSTNLPHYDPLFIPFIEDKRVTLSDAGLATGAVISTNLLDSIAKYAEQAGLPIKTALGLATKESTLGNPTDDSSVVKLIGKDKALAMQRGQTGQHLNTTGAAIDARELINYYKDTWNPYEIAIEVAKRKSSKLVPDPDGNVYDSKGNIVGTRFYHDDPGYEEYKQEKRLAEDKRRQVLNDILLSGEKYADNLAEKYKDKIKGNILKAAFVDYKNNPHGYNPGQPNYSELVERRASEVWNSPEVQAWYNDYKNQKADGGSLNSKTWNDLSLSEKSEMMRVAIENGITTLPEIRKAYNQFAEGGNLFSGEENHSSQMHQGYVYDVLPKMLKEAGLNVRVTSGYRRPGQAGKAGSRSWHTHHGAVDIVPQGKTTFEDIENALYNNPTISRYMIDNGFGLLDESDRTAESRATMKKTGATGAHFHIGKDSKAVSAYSNKMSSIWDNNMSQLETAINQPTLPVFMPSNPQAFFTPLESYQRPVVVEEPLVQAAMENPYSPEQIEKEERAQGLRNLGLAMSIMREGQEQSYSPLWEAVSMLSGNQMAKGGKIHIKSENREKFTALKKRTGHSATWFKQHGTPAQKKMATFALNSRHWKHGLGGNLFSGEDEPTQQMNSGLNLYRNTNKAGDVWYTYQETPDSEEILLTPTNKRFSDDPTNWDYKDASGREYSPRMVNPTNSSTLEASEKMGPLEKYVAELNWRAKNDPASIALQGKYTMPAIAAPLLAPLGEAFAGTTIAGIPATTWANTAMAAGFAGHGLNHTINEGIDGWGDAAMTALELAPLGRLAKPVYEGVVQPGMRLFNSPLTGNWTRIGNREYRLSPNSLGANGSPIESRSIVPQITAENAASMTPEQWTAAQDAAIARGDMAEAQRLRDLHFKISAPNTKVVDGAGNPQLVIHKTPNDFTVFDNSRSIGNLNWAATQKAFEGENGVFATGAGANPKEMRLYVNMKNPHYPTIDEGMEPAFINEGEDGILGIVDKDMTDFYKSASDAGEGFNMSLGVDNPYALKSADAVTYDKNGVRIPLGERDNFNINDIRYFKDDFGKEVLITPYPGTDTQLVNAANEGHLAALRHQFSQDKTEQLKSVMGWDDAAIAEYQDEILRSSGSPADMQVRGTDTGFKEIGNHAGNISQNGESVSHSMTLNRDRIPDDATAIETGIHEMGVHGRTLSIDPSEIGVEGSYSNTIAQKFPRIAEVMKKNQEIAKQTLIPNDRGKLFQQIKKSSDLERWLYENNVPVEQWEEYFNDWKYYKYVTEDQELLARGYTGQVYETVDPSRETLNIQQLKKFFTPESTEKYKKAVLSTLPFLFTGYGLSQGNE